MDHTLAVGIGVFAGFVFSIVVHECAHAVVARRLGDDTAYLQGRISLNPAVHIDPFMSILLPLTLWIVNSPVLFGGARPVPVDIHNLRTPRLMSMMWVALAGPISNILLAFTFALLLNFIPVIFDWNPVFALNLWEVLVGIVGTNVVLALFNMIPIPPLDGSRILAAFLPEEAGWSLYRFEPLGMLLVMILVVAGGTRLLLSAPVAIVTEGIVTAASFGEWTMLAERFLIKLFPAK